MKRAKIRLIFIKILLYPRMNNQFLYRILIVNIKKPRKFFRIDRVFPCRARGFSGCPAGRRRPPFHSKKPAVDTVRRRASASGRLPPPRQRAPDGPSSNVCAQRASWAYWLRISLMRDSASVSRAAV